MNIELVAQMFKNYQSNVLFHLEGKTRPAAKSCRCKLTNTGNSHRQLEAALIIQGCGGVVVIGQNNTEYVHMHSIHGILKGKGNCMGSIIGAGREDYCRQAMNTKTRSRQIQASTSQNGLYE